ncbi:hypothetical protein PCE1_002213 [Barthelona sp. PCE]
MPQSGRAVRSSSAVFGSSRVREIRSNDARTNSSFIDNYVRSTKYRWYTFPFRFLMEQYSQLMNVYFTIVSLLQIFGSTIASVHWITTVAPLLMVLAFAGIKELFDDFARKRSDNHTNEREYEAVVDGKLTTVQSKTLRVGQIIRLKKNEHAPADIMLLRSTHKQGAAYVMTANIDGETDNKLLNAPTETQNMTDEQIQNLKMHLRCPVPNAILGQFDSVMTLPGSAPVPIGGEQLVMQGVVIKNIQYMYGVVVYTGKHTKVNMNKFKAPTKWTSSDIIINRQTLFIWLSQFLFVIGLGFMGQVFAASEDVWYLRMGYSISPLPQFTIYILRFFLLCTLMIPISMKFTLDFVKAIMGKFIDWDLDLYDHNRKIPAQAKSLQLADDLGRIEYIFSDKTGTLTENIMLFKSCFIDGQIFDSNNKQLVQNKLQESLHEGDKINTFFHTMALCNTIDPVKCSNKIYYQGTSPDEVAIVRAAQMFGLSLFEREEKSVALVDTAGVVRNWRVHCVLKFSSARKRMSVLAEDLNTNSFYLFTKGADEVLFNLMQTNDIVKGQVSEAVERFSEQGLRTLAFAWKPISQAEFSTFMANYQAASCAMSKRKEHIEGVYASIEQNLILLGCSAIEDKLQAQVPSTIKFLRNAGVRVWMLTGDRRTTAIQIAKSCNLINTRCNSCIIEVNGSNPKDIMASMKKSMVMMKEAKSDDTVGEIITVLPGSTVPTLLELCPRDLLTLTTESDTVIGCRLWPRHKAQLVEMVHKELKKVTLAIGDGGNDCQMIQAAKIGVGIVGRESLQAARSADYAIAQFRYLKKLMVVHGRQNYRRISFIAQYCFYKSLAIAFQQLMYSVYSHFSGSSFFNSFSLTAHNMFFTACQPVAYTIDEDVPNEVAMANPLIYTDSRRGKYLNRKTFTGWVVRGFYHAVVSMFITIFFLGGDYVHPKTGLPYDYYTLPMVSFTIISTIQLPFLYLHFNSLNKWAHLTILISYALYPLSIWYMNDNSLHGFATQLMSDDSALLVILLGVILCILPEVYIKWRQRFKSPSIRYRILSQKNGKRDKVNRILPLETLKDREAEVYVSSSPYEQPLESTRRNPV